MRFVTTINRVKRSAKRMRKALREHGQDLSYAACLNLVSQIYGYSHFRELQMQDGREPFSAFDLYVDDATLEARHSHQELIMASAGFGDIAGDVLDKVDPTGGGYEPPDHTA